MARTESFWDTGVGGTYLKTISPIGYDILINGSNHYLNFGSTVGSTGYGFRDNSGVMEVKSSGGSWIRIGSVSGEIIITHKDGTQTGYQSSADTDVARGTALLLAVSEAVDEDTLHLSANTFDIGFNYIDTSLGNTGNFSICGAGKYNTIIKSSYGDNTAILQPIIQGSSNSCVKDLSIVGTAVANTYQACWGVKDTGTTVNILNAKIDNVYMEAGTDALYFQGNSFLVHVNRLTTNTKWDSMVYGAKAASEVHITNSVIQSTADAAWNGGDIARGLVGSSNGGLQVINVSDTIITCSGSDGISQGVSAGNRTTINLNNVKITTSGTGTNHDIFNSDQTLAFINVNTDCIYDVAKTSGVITYVSAPVIGKNLLSYSGTPTNEKFLRGDLTWASEPNTPIYRRLNQTSPQTPGGGTDYFQSVNIGGGTTVINVDGDGATGDGGMHWDSSGNLTVPSLTLSTPLTETAGIVDGNLRGAYLNSAYIKLLDMENATAEYPSGITISAINVQCSVADPTTELSAKLMYCDAQGTGAFPGASPTEIDDISTTTGNFSVTGLTTSVATNKIVYLQITADPTDYNTSWSVNFKYTRN